MSKIIMVDLDNTLCATNGLDYSNAIPIIYRINSVNRWFDRGDTIIIWTARGCAPTKCVEEKEAIMLLTLKQLKDWGVKYTRLDMNKPLFDCMIDDRAWNSDHWKAWL